MSTTPLTTLLQRKVQKFARLKKQISNRKISAGDFRARRSYHHLFSRLHKLARRIQELNSQLRLATTAGVLVLAGTIAEAQTPIPIPLPGLGANALGPFTVADRAHNPLRGPIDRSRWYKPTAVDLDKDGDLDLVMGDFDSNYHYFKNTGSATNPQYVELKDNDNPFNYVYGWSAPAFADLDKDGDLDMFVGEEYNDSDTPTYGSVHYFVNNGGKFWTETTPGDFNANEQRGPWNQVNKTGNPVNLLVYDTHVMPNLIDLDNDGDLDLLVYGDYDAEDPAYFFLNNGSNVFSAGQSYLPTAFIDSWYNLDLNFGDVDEDGDADLVIGDIDGAIHFLANNGGTYTEQTGPWNAGAKTGNPFNGLSPVDYSGGNQQANIAFGDFNGDGHMDAFVGFQSGTSPYYGAEIPLYLRNNGHGNFEYVTGLDSPIDGINVNGIATIDFQDINGDKKPDAIISGTGDDFTQVYLGGATGFSLATTAQNPLNTDQLGYLYDGMSGQLVDFDNDNDLDFIGSNNYGQIRYYKNNGGTYELQPDNITNPFYTNDLQRYDNDYGPLVMAFVDIDADKDLDLFIGEKYGYVDFFRNDNGTLNLQGTRDYDHSDFTPLDDLNPLGSVLTPQPYYGNGNGANIRFADLDNDGDYDALIGYSAAALDSDGFNVAPASILYYENTGTPKVPAFTERASPFNADDLQDSPLLKFIDYDGDGDLDAFMGHYEYDGYTSVGRFKFFINDNPTPAFTIAANLQYKQGATPVALDANIDLTDEDNDIINQVTIAIKDFKSGKETLTFTAKAPVVGSFDAAKGVLTLSGKGTLADYTTVLKTVSYQYTGEKPANSGRKPSSGSKTVTLARTIDLTAFDADMTISKPKSLAVQITFPNAPPTIATSGTAAQYVGSPVLVDGGVTVSDADDGTLSSATIKFDPAKFIAAEDILEFSDQNGITGSFSSSTGVLTLTGTSSAANYQSALRSINYKNLLPKPTNADRTIQYTVSDGENNSNTANGTVTVDVKLVLTIYNGISPNDDGLNSFFKIENIEALEPSNRVTIFNRWGDKVFDVNNYNNADRKFTGVSSSGNELPSGDYFYKIEFASGKDPINGYLTIKR